MSRYDELKETASILIGAGWTAEERADILAQHQDDVDFTECEWDKVFDLMEEFE